MPTISEQLDAAIRTQTAEIERLDTDYAANKAGAEKRLALLQNARAAVTPQIDGLVTQLRAAGIFPKE